MNTTTLTKLCKFISYMVMSLIFLGIVSVILLGIIHNNSVCTNIANNTNVTHNVTHINITIDTTYITLTIGNIAPIRNINDYCINQSTKDILKNSIIIITCSVLGLAIISCIALIIFDQCFLKENVIEGTHDDEEHNLLINDVPYKDYLQNTF